MRPHAQAQAKPCVITASPSSSARGRKGAKEGAGGSAPAVANMWASLEREPEEEAEEEEAEPLAAAATAEAAAAAAGGSEAAAAVASPGPGGEEEEEDEWACPPPLGQGPA